tara:strand:+ start:409 stop:549 length:141 start_codon:yes stop_codon:yes gene_type:complete
MGLVVGHGRERAGVTKAFSGLSGKRSDWLVFHFAERNYIDFEKDGL